MFKLSCDAALGNCTAEPFDFAQDKLRAQSKEFLIKKLSDLCELGAFAVDIPHRKKPVNQMFSSVAI